MTDLQEQRRRPESNRFLIPHESNAVREPDIPEEFRRPALVCSVDGCRYGFTISGTEHWPDTIGIRAEDGRCSEHGNTLVRGWLDDRKLWR